MLWFFFFFECLSCAIKKAPSRLPQPVAGAGADYRFAPDRLDWPSEACYVEVDQVIDKPNLHAFGLWVDKPGGLGENTIWEGEIMQTLRVVLPPGNLTRAPLADNEHLSIKLFYRSSAQWTWHQSIIGSDLIFQGLHMFEKLPHEEFPGCLLKLWVTQRRTLVVPFSFQEEQ